MNVVVLVHNFVNQGWDECRKCERKLSRKKMSRLTIYYILGVQLEDKSAASVSAATIMVGEHVKSRFGYDIGGVEFNEDSASTMTTIGCSTRGVFCGCEK